MSLPRNAWIKHGLWPTGGTIGKATAEQQCKGNKDTGKPPAAAASLHPSIKMLPSYCNSCVTPFQGLQTATRSRLSSKRLKPIAEQHSLPNRCRSRRGTFKRDWHTQTPNAGFCTRTPRQGAEEFGGGLGCPRSCQEKGPGQIGIITGLGKGAC